jgi:alpha-beta hydrolase superfamily lysophospholipase
VRTTDVDIEVRSFGTDQPARGSIVLLHGWGGSAESLAPFASAFAAHGYLVTATSMRGFGGSSGDDDCGLHQPDDIGPVVAWARDEAPGAAPVALVGISQGGQVALLAAARGVPVDAVAAWAPVTDVARWRDTTQYPGIPEYIATTCADGRFDERSPLAVADRISVPVLLVHGDRDTRVPTEQSVLLHERMVATGGACTLELLQGVGHGRDRTGSQRTVGLTVAFLDRVAAGAV